MLPTTIKSQINSIWNDFWAGGISNPLEVMEQLTYLLFIKRLDELHTLAERKATRLKTEIEKPIFPSGTNEAGRSYEDLRWSKFKNFDAGEMYEIVDDHVFPFIRTMSGGSTLAKHMSDARFTIPTAALLRKAVDALDEVPMVDRDTKGDVYEYMLSKIASAGQNGQFRTPRHIIDLMVEMTKPTVGDTICDPACGTAGFLVSASEYVRRNFDTELANASNSDHFHRHMFSGFDFDSTMLRIGSMNMILHGIENPDIAYRDSLAQTHSASENSFSLILANPPFAGSLDYEGTSKELLDIVKTKKTELLFLALFLRLLKPGGRAAVIVPDGVLFGASNAHKELRKLLVEGNRLDGVVSLPSGVFKPYAGVSTAILLFSKTNSGGTENVWFYNVEEDGLSLDDKREPKLAADKLGISAMLTDMEHAKNNLPDVLRRWEARNGSELSRARTEQSFCVPKKDIAARGYDLSLSCYKEAVYEAVEYAPTVEILDDIERIESEIVQGIADLRSLLR